MDPVINLSETVLLLHTCVATFTFELKLALVSAYQDWRRDPADRSRDIVRMHATLLALGSRGDVLPSVLLGKHLRSAGHQVRFITFENFAGLVAKHGLDFFPVAGNAESLLSGAAGLSLAESGRNPLKMFQGAMASFGALAEGYARDLSAPELQETDVIINQLPGGLYGRELAEKAGIPMIAAAVIPLVPTKAAPMVAFPQWPGRFSLYNRLTHFVARQLVWQAFRPVINRWRRGTLGLGYAPLLGGLENMGQQPLPVINGFSRHVVPRPADWGGHVHITGYWFPEPSAWEPPVDLARFLAVEPPPVFVGFGSMPVRDPQQTTETIVSALKQADCRAVLQAGWAGLGEAKLPENVFRLEYAPYEWLFTRVSAAVHHGGSGTTAAALRAGAPSILVPFVFDQFYWGERVARLGVGSRPIPYRDLSADILANALGSVLGNGAMRSRSSRLAHQIEQENGLDNAREIIERVVGAESRARSRSAGLTI